MFWLALASQLTLPVPLGLPSPDVRAVFSSDDMPAYVQMQGRTRFVFTRTTVRPDGTTQDCAIERGSGDAKLDVLTCSIILQRARFQPARWADGSPAHGVLRVPVTWVIGSAPSKGEVQRAYPADLELTVDKLPAGAGKRASLALVIAVDERGRAVGCDEVPPPSTRRPAKTFPELAPIACAQMMSQSKANSAKDAAGAPVRSVQTASVVFIRGR